MVHLLLMRFLAGALFFFAWACAPPPPPAPQLAPNQLVGEQVFSAIRTDGSFVYYIDDSRLTDGESPSEPLGLRLMRVSVDGGPPVVLAPLPSVGFDETEMASFMIDATTAYCPINHQILAVPLKGGAPVVLFDDAPEIGVADAIVVDDTSLYWVLGGGLNTPFNFDFQVLKMSKSGGPPTVIVSTDLGFGATEIAIAGPNLYWPGSSCSGTVGPDRCGVNDIIAEVPTAEGSSRSRRRPTPTVWTSEQLDVQQVATDGTSLYWLNEAPTSSTLQTAPIASPSSVTVLATGIPFSVSPIVPSLQVASDGTVFWLDGTGSAVTALKNGKTTTYASGRVDPISYFTFDAVNVYWATAKGIFWTPR